MSTDLPGSLHVKTLRLETPRHRRAGRALKVVSVLASALFPALASAAPWQSAPAAVLKESASVTTQRLELADVDMDGDVDIITANCEGDALGGSLPQLNTLYLNQGAKTFEATADTVINKGAGDTAYAIKAADINEDGAPDLVIGTNFATQSSYVLLNTLVDSIYDPNVDLIEIEPGTSYSVGDLEIGDVNGDGDLDILASDWGKDLPYNGKLSPGNPLRLWLGDGTGMFMDSGLVLPQVAYSFDVELVDLDNDYDLDALAATLGYGTAVVLINDGQGKLENYDKVPYLSDPKKYSAAFTVMDFDADSRLDLIALQMGASACQIINGKEICSARNVLLTNQDQADLFVDKSYWGMLSNPSKVDFDAATLDFNNDGAPDFLVVGEPLSGMAVNSRLLLNNKVGVVKIEPEPEANALSSVVQAARGVMFADFDGDKREDVAVSVRADLPLNQVFFGADAMDGVPVDMTGPHIGPHEAYAKSLYFDEPATIRARVHDYKTPTTWHDYQYDPNIGTYNLDKQDDPALQHKRRVPYVEYTFGLGPDELDKLALLADSDPAKHIAPGVWYGESLWTIDILPAWMQGAKRKDTLTWRLCAIDAAGNQSCVGPFQVDIETHCGDSTLDVPDEECDDPNDPLCVECVLCGNGVVAGTEECDEKSDLCSATCTLVACGDNKVEGKEECDDDTNPLCVNCALIDCGNGVCDPNDCSACPQDCTAEECPSCVTEAATDPGCGMCDGVCDPAQDCENCPTDCDPAQCMSCVTEGADEPGCNMCGNGICEPSETPQTCPADCMDPATTGTAGDTACTEGGIPGACELDDDGCGCDTQSGGPKGILASLLLLAAYGVRRRRRSA